MIKICASPIEIKVNMSEMYNTGFDLLHSYRRFSSCYRPFVPLFLLLFVRLMISIPEVSLSEINALLLILLLSLQSYREAIFYFDFYSYILHEYKSICNKKIVQ